MKFEAVSQYSSRDLEAFQRASDRHFRPRRAKLLRRLYLVVAAAFLAVSAAGLAAGAGAWLPWLGFLLGVALLVWSLFAYPLAAWAAARGLPRRMNGVHFSFEEEGFTVRNAVETVEHTYSELTDIAEDDRYVFLFLTKQAGYVVDKKNFTTGRAEELRPFLTGKLQR